MNWLRRLTHSPTAVLIAHRLGLAEPLKRAYYRLAKSRDGTLQANIRGIPVRFHAASPGELRMLEGFANGGQECFMKVLATELGPGDVFYDVGSNFGQYAVVAAKIVGPSGQVVAFEPSRKSFERLTKNIALNGLSNVRAYPIALGDHAYRTTLVVNGFLDRQSRLQETEGSTAVAGGDAQTADVVSGDSFCAAERLRLPNVVKIDVEGFEPLVLKGLEASLRRDSCRLLCCEVHRGRIAQGLGPESLCEQIRDLGFLRLEKISRGDELHVIAMRV